ncbi:type II secretion system protein [Sporosarcina aquimarina]|uniref:Type II secretion system protein n=1 Tax=Sporosarcina aquimarina TaxID=114975 RepID=A0ABU4FY39_9BACL|nr:type II secretion system protein [Sporosarcina aquimarina]MDW0109644.1 type II secretion system protein [Sporosarcina aquimarina]
MKKFLQKKLKNEKGLTLVELLAVIVILGIIAAIAVPAIGGIIDNSRIKAVKADAQTILSAANMYFAENPDATDVNLMTLVDGNYMDDTGKFEKPKSADAEPKVTKATGGNKFNGSAKYKGDETVTFEDATSKMITESGNSKDVPKK